MWIINDTASMSRALDQPLDPDLKRLLTLRRDEVSGDDAARFLVVEPGDRLADVERAIGFPLTLDEAPTWEWAMRHGAVVEVAFIFGDTVDVLLIPDRDDIDSALIALLRLHAADDLEPQRTSTP